ncbi:hypothetical protein GCM10022631_12610 [Deinococcus rubellus]
MPHDLLQGEHITTVPEKLNGKSSTEGVWGGIFSLHPLRLPKLHQSNSNSTFRKLLSSAAEEDMSHSSMIRLPLLTEIVSNSLHSFGSNWHEPFLTPLTHHPEQTSIEEQILKSQLCEFLKAYPSVK